MCFGLVAVKPETVKLVDRVPKTFCAIAKLILRVRRLRKSQGHGTLILSDQIDIELNKNHFMREHVLG